MNYNSELEGTPAEKELEIPDIPWLYVDKGILRLRKIAVLEWIHYGKTNPPQWEGSKDMSFMNLIRYKLVKGTTGYLTCFPLAIIFLEMDLWCRDAAAKLDELNAMY